MTLPISGLAAALSGLILVALAFRVSSLRMRHQVATGDGDIPALARAIRVHANSIEQMPIFLVQCLCYEANVGSTPLLAAVSAGATAVVQPGGSIHDAEVIAAADEAGIAMVFTGLRHFRH